MTTQAEAAPGAGQGSSLLDAARDLRPLLRDQAPQGDDDRCITTDAVRGMADAGLFRTAVARAAGGYESSMSEQFEIIEAVSEGDGSAGWILMVATDTSSIASAALEPSMARALWVDNPRTLLCSSFNPLGKAYPEGEGHRIGGRWPFASGCQHADWFWGAAVLQDDGAPLLGPSGRPEVREFLVPRGSFEIIDTWDVSGMRGSGSHDVTVQGVVVPPDLTTSRTRPVKEQGTLFRIPQQSRLAFNKAAVASGVARAAIDGFIDLAVTKVPYSSQDLLRERPLAQIALAEAEIDWQASRSFVLSAIASVWDTVDRGELPTQRQRTLLFLASAHLVAASVRSVDRVHKAAGSTANFRKSVLDRCFRDVHVVAQHATVNQSVFVASGRSLLGMDSGSHLL